MVSTKEQLEAAIEALRIVDTYDIVAEFERELLNHCGHWVGVRLDPRDGQWHSVCEASRSVSCDEYFNESGSLSQMTVLSGQTSEYPGPTDGYEWEASDTGTYWGNDSGEYCTDDDGQLEEFLEKYHSEVYEAAAEGTDLEVIAKSAGVYRFSVSTNPVNPDYSYRMKEVQDQINERIEIIQSEIDELEAE